MKIHKSIRMFLKHLILFMFGGFVYVGMELCFRGYSHISMWFLGGLCFILIGAINELIPWSMKFWKQMLIGAIIITVLEFITGIVVNLWLGLQVWDYSTMPLNILGQICLPFTIIWFFISAIAIVVDDHLRYKWFGEEKPRYDLI